MARMLARRVAAGQAFRPWARFKAVVLLAVLLVAAIALPTAYAADSAPLTVVMDGSGSMWGKIGAERLAKFQLARQGLAEALPKLPPGVPLGLVAFGHRRVGCQDVEVLRAPEAGNATRVVDLLAEFNPRGRGPVTAGLQAALETIPKGSPGSILVIHDDLDNCQQNPCSLTDAIRLQHPQVVIHVVSIAMNSGRRATDAVPDDPDRRPALSRGHGRADRERDRGSDRDRGAGAERACGHWRGRRPGRATPRRQAVRGCISSRR